MSQTYSFTCIITRERFYNNGWGAYSFTTEENLPHTILNKLGKTNTYQGSLNGKMFKLEIGLLYNVKANLVLKNTFWGYEVIDIAVQQSELNKAKFLEQLCTKRQYKNITEIYPNFVDLIIEEKEIDHSKIKGVNKITFEKIKDKVTSNYWMNEIITMLSPLGITSKMISKLMDSEKSPAILKYKLTTNPYVLTSIHGLGFKKVDGIAIKINPQMEVSEYRLKSYLEYFFKQMALQSGDTLIEGDFLNKDIEKNLYKCFGLYRDLLKKEYNLFLENKKTELLYFFKTKVGLRFYYEREFGIIDNLNALNNVVVKFPKKDNWEDLSKNHIGFPLTKKQKEAVAALDTHNVLLLSGKAGCLSGDTLLSFNRGRRFAGRIYSVELAYKKFNDIKAGVKNYKKWDKSFQTNTLSLKGDTIGYNKVNDIVYSGKKQTYKVVAESGRFICVSEEHPFKVPSNAPNQSIDGFKKLCDLNVGDSIMLRSREAAKGRNPKLKAKRKIVYGIVYHPYKYKKIVNGKDYGRLYYSKLVIEANMNNVDINFFIEELKNNSLCDKLYTFLDPKLAIHHIDENPLNDEYSNLKVMTKKEHDTLHGYNNIKNMRYSTVVEEKIISIEPYKFEDTYDLIMTDPYRNYVANDFVVHNSGKTSTVVSIIKAFNNYSISLSALSAKAAARIYELTGHPAKTMHRTLKFEKTKFFYNEDNKLGERIHVIDESSMNESWIMDSYVKAVEEGCKVIFVGDPGQLPPIGAGNIFTDLITEEPFKHIHLDKIHRQAQKSAITMDANIISTNINPLASDEKGISREWFTRGELNDMSYFFTVFPELIHNQAINRYMRGVDKFGIDDTVLLCPMKERGMNCTMIFNNEIQDLLISDSRELKRGKQIFKKGAKVIQRKNDYTEKKVINGDVGYITEINNDRTFEVKFRDRSVFYPADDISQIELAYALTIHLCQGSQYKSVVNVIDNSHYILLSNQALYTAITRASVECSLVSERKAFNRCISTNLNRRSTFLSNILKDRREKE